MNLKPALAIAHVVSEPWGAAFLREHDLMIAANVLASLESGEPLYNADFDRACAERLIPLDGGLDLRQLDTVTIPEAAEPHLQHRQTQETIKATLAAASRGHWAVFRLGERYDAFISNGCGGVETESGLKFTYGSASAPAFTGPKMYAHVLGMMNYLRRNAVQNLIIEYSCEAAGLAPGATARDIDLGGKTWNRVVYAGKKPGYFVGGTNAYAVTAHRRGVKAQGFVVEPSAFTRIFDLAYAMPEDFVDAGNPARVLDIVKPRPVRPVHSALGPALEIRLA